MKKFEDLVKVEEAKELYNVFAKWKQRGFIKPWNAKPMEMKDAGNLVDSIERGNYKDIERIVIVKKGEIPK